ncbi:MAG: P-II family nitrogen regulator [Spirochaetales bacterium]|nr:P-II family nitrogen regulator [Spirochaetales bacterium]
MVKIEAIIRPDKLEALVDRLSELGYSGLNYTDVQGHGRQKGMKELFRGREYEVKFMPKIKIEIVTADDKTEIIVEAIMNLARTGKIGDGKIFIIPITDAIRVRTGERGEAAL